MIFHEGQRVRCVRNPYSPMFDYPCVGDEGTITTDGENYVGVRFGETLFRAWVTKDPDLKPTLALIKETEPAEPLNEN